jgi:hypothetical protein
MKLASKIHRLFVKPKPKRKYVKRVPMARVKNHYAERIESMKFEVPALRVGVLTYQPGELTTNDPELQNKTIKLYYPPEAVSHKKFLDTLKTAMIGIDGGHGNNTHEDNKKIDGWSHTVFYDEEKKAAMLNGVVKGHKEINFVKENLKKNDEDRDNNFGASAFIDIFNIIPKSGITPDGQEYNAIAKDLKATHVAFAPHVRDPENKIKVLNTVVINTDGKYNNEVKNMEMSSDQIAAIVKNAVSDAVNSKNDGDRLEKLEQSVTALANTVQALVKNQEEAEEEKKKEEEAEAENKKGKAKNEDGEEAEEEVTLENTKPAQALIATAGNALNVDFGSKTPSFATLASLLGITETDPAKRIAAVNAKCAELEAGKSKDSKTVTTGVF